MRVESEEQHSQTPSTGSAKPAQDPAELEAAYNSLPRVEREPPTP